MKDLEGKDKKCKLDTGKQTPNEGFKEGDDMLRMTSKEDDVSTCVLNSRALQIRGYPWTVFEAHSSDADTNFLFMQAPLNGLEG